MGKSDRTPTLQKEIADLSDLSKEALIERWTKILGSPPPTTLSKDLLIRGIAYERQVQALGGLHPSEAEALIKMAPGNGGPQRRELRPGTRLYRLWRGVTHEVLVLDKGLSWQGSSYTSLSQVARAITGTRWSGPKFFGIKT